MKPKGPRSRVTSTSMIASSSCGIAVTPDAAALMIRTSGPPYQPLARPSVRPIPSRIRAAVRTMVNVSLAPASSRDSWSRPRASVPNQCTWSGRVGGTRNDKLPFGSSLTSIEAPAFGSSGATPSPKTPIASSATNPRKPKSNAGFPMTCRSSRALMSRPGPVHERNPRRARATRSRQRTPAQAGSRGRGVEFPEPART